MNTTRRGFIGALFVGGAAAPVLLNKGERVLSSAEARDLVTNDDGDGVEIPVSPSTMLTQGLNEPSTAEFTGPVGAYTLGQRVKLTIPEYGILFVGVVVRITTHVGHLCQYVATTELVKVQPTTIIHHNNLDSRELARRVSEEVYRTLKSSRRFV